LTLHGGQKQTRTITTTIIVLFIILKYGLLEGVGWDKVKLINLLNSLIYWKQRAEMA